MGGGLTTRRKQNDDKKDNNDVTYSSRYSQNITFVGEIKFSTLLSALNKLSFLFEVNECVANSLIDEILDERHVCYESQSNSVAELVSKHSDLELTPYEVLNLIKYVEVHQFKQCDDKVRVVEQHAETKCEVEQSEFVKNGDGSSNHSNRTLNEALTEENLGGTVYPPLFCPIRSDVFEWMKAIRRKERNNSKYHGAPNLKRLRDQVSERKERANSFYG